MERFLHMPGIEIDNSWKKSPWFLENMKETLRQDWEKKLIKLKSPICMFDAWKKIPNGSFMVNYDVRK